MQASKSNVSNLGTGEDLQIQHHSICNQTDLCIDLPTTNEVDRITVAIRQNTVKCPILYKGIVWDKCNNTHQISSSVKSLQRSNENLSDQVNLIEPI